MIASSSRERAQGPRFSQTWKPDLDTPSASQSHATGQTERVLRNEAELHVDSLAK
jgi:hypothetical protein